MSKRQPQFDQTGEIGYRLKLERQRIGLNQGDFAALVGGSLQSQMRYETGQTLPKLDYLLALAEHGVDHGYVVTGVRDDGSILADEFEREIVGSLRLLDKVDRQAMLHIIKCLAELKARKFADSEGYSAGWPQGEANPGTLHSPTIGYRAEPERREDD